MSCTIIVPLKHKKSKIIILTHVYEKIEIWTLKGTTRPHFLFQSWYPFPTENSTGVQCLRTSGKFGCAWACKEVFFIKCIFQDFKANTGEDSICSCAENFEKLRLYLLLVSFSGVAVNLQKWSQINKSQMVACGLVLYLKQAHLVIGIDRRCNWPSALPQISASPASKGSKDKCGLPISCLLRNKLGKCLWN